MTIAYEKGITVATRQHKVVQVLHFDLCLNIVVFLSAWILKITFLYYHQEHCVNRICVNELPIHTKTQIGMYSQIHDINFSVVVSQRIEHILYLCKKSTLSDFLNEKN